MPLPKAPTKMGEVLKAESTRKSQTGKKVKKESLDSSKPSKQKEQDNQQIRVKHLNSGRTF